MTNDYHDESVNILGVRVNSSQPKRVLDYLLKRLMKNMVEKTLVVFTPTTEQIMLAQSNKHFCTTLNGSDLNLPDSVGLVWADWWRSRWRRQPWQLKARMAGVDVAEILALKALEADKKVFLLGGRQAAVKAAERFKNYDLRFKNNIRFDEGAREIEKETTEERDKVLGKISEFKPDLLLVAYGAPWQEYWVLANKAVLGKAGVKVAMVVGGAFDMWAKITPRAPMYLRKIGLEWLWRLGLQPGRWRRQLALIKFVGKAAVMT